MRLSEIFLEFREVLLERSSFASSKLLKRLEPQLKLLTRRDVAADATLIMAQGLLCGLARVQRGSKLWAAVLNLRGLQLRKQALKRALEPLGAEKRMENMERNEET